MVPRTLLLQVKMQVNVIMFKFTLNYTHVYFPISVKIMITCIYMYIFSVGIQVILGCIPCWSYNAAKWSGPLEETITTEAPCHRRCGTIETPPCSD